MAKKSEYKNDPIVWGIIRSRGGWGRPVPLNKPSWKYLREESHSPSLIKTFFNIFAGLIFILMSFLLLYIAISMFSSPNGILVSSGFSFFSLLMLLGGIKKILIPFKQYINYKNYKIQRPRIRKKKLPKYRKDYK